MEAEEEENHAGWLAFGGYTTLGYLALGMHRWLFAPGLVESGSAARLLLVVANLVAGAWCFVRALRAAWSVTRNE